MALQNAVEIRAERATLVNEARKTLEIAEAREGGATDEDRAICDKALGAAEEMLDRALRIERFEAAETSLTTPAERRSLPIDEVVTRRETRDRKAETEETKIARMGAYRHWLRTGEVREALRPNYRATLDPGETRDVVISTPASGGYLITPVEISSDIVSQIDNLVFIRDLCKKSNSVTTVTSAQKLGIRIKSARMNVADWTQEIGTVTPDEAMQFNRRDLEPNQLTKLALISNRTLMLTTDAEKEVNEELAYQHAIAQENGFLNGNGIGQPLGGFTASSTGIDTSRDVTSAAATTISGDDLINLKFSLRQPYLQGPSVAWIMHRFVVQAIRTLKVSAAGLADALQYVWQPGLTNGQPDRILDIPYYMSEYAPSSIAANLYTVLLGNFRYYRIAQLPDIAVQRLVELYAATGEVGFKGTSWVDGAPVMAEAFARLKQHS